MSCKISIITVCYKSVSTLRDTLESVLTQAYSNYEYIVVDGNSKDGTTDLLRDYESRYEGRLRWISEPDHGIYDAMNKGIRMAAGDVIGFLNADDYYHDEQVLSDIAAAFDDSDSPDAVHGSLSFINASRRVVRRWKGTPYAPGAFQRGWMPAHPTFYCKRECFERYGSFEPSIGSAADFELMLRFVEKHRISLRCLSREFIYMRTGGSSTSGFRAVLRNTRQNQEAFRRNGIPCPWHYPFTRLLGKLGAVASLFGSSR